MPFRMDKQPVLSPTIDVVAGNFVNTRSFATHGACKTAPMDQPFIMQPLYPLPPVRGTSVCLNTNSDIYGTPRPTRRNRPLIHGKNGVTVGTNSTTYTNASWVNGDQVQW